MNFYILVYIVGSALNVFSHAMCLLLRSLLAKSSSGKVVLIVTLLNTTPVTVVFNDLSPSGTVCLSFDQQIKAERVGSAFDRVHDRYKSHTKNSY